MFRLTTNTADPSIKIGRTGLRTAVNDLTNENNKLKALPNERNAALENREKGYLSKTNSLEQRIGILQKSRNSLAALISKNSKQQYQEPLIDPISKKRIFGYGYDYHIMNKGKKN